MMSENLEHFQERKIMYQKNLAWFEENKVSFYQNIKNQEYNFSELVFDAEEIVNIVIGDKKIYPQDAQQFAKEQIANIDNYTKLEYDVSPNSFSYSDRIFGRGYSRKLILQRAISTNIHYFCAELSAKVLDKGLVTAQALTNDTKAKRYINNGAFIICAGLGLGYQIEEIFAEYEFSTLVILETQINFIQHAAHIHDFSKWQEKCRARSGNLVIICTDNNESFKPYLSNGIYNDINYSLFPDSFIFKHLDNSFYNDVITTKEQWSKDFSINKGFIEDEAIMAMNHVINVFRGLKGKQEYSHKILNARPIEYRKLPILVVGNGPSLDSSIEIIREKVKQGYMLMACGTAVGTLLNNDLMPHFYTNTENTFLNYWAMKNSMKQAQKDPRFKDIIFVGLATTGPGLVNLFKRAILIMRTHSAGSTNIVKHCVKSKYKVEVRYIAPNVANTAISTAIALGFRDVYLFGIDLGRRQAQETHAKTSIYQKNKKFMENIFLQKGYIKEDLIRAEFQLRWQTVGKMGGAIKTKANFGGNVTATGILTMAKDTLVSMASHLKKAHHNTYRIFNCSDGANIKNIIPLLPHLVPDLLDSSSEKVLEELEKIYNSYENFDFSDEALDSYKKSLHKNIEVVDADQEDFNVIIDKYSDFDFQGYVEFQKFSEEIIKLCTMMNDRDFEVKKFIRGSVNQNLLYIYKLFTFIEPEKRNEYMAIALEYFQEIVNHYYEYVKIFLQNQLDFLSNHTIQDNENLFSIAQRDFFEHHYHKLCKARGKVEKHYGFVFLEEGIVNYNNISS